MADKVAAVVNWLVELLMEDDDGHWSWVWRPAAVTNNNNNNTGNDNNGGGGVGLV